MHLCLVTDTYPPDVNGVALSLSRLKGALEDCGHRVEVIRPHSLDLRETIDEKSGLPDLRRWLPSLPLPGYKGLRFGLPGWDQLKRRWSKDRPDAVYVATESPLGMSAVQVARQLGLRLASGFHTNFHSYTNDYNVAIIEGMVSSYLRYFHNETQITFVPALDLAQQLRDAGYHRVEILGRGVNIQLFSPEKRDVALRQSWGVTDKEPVALYVSRVAAEKNIPLVMRAFEQMKERNPQLQCVVVGDGPKRESLQAQYPDYIWAGLQRGEDLARYYASADLFVFASVTETFGNVILEAMASGLVVSSFDYAAATQLIENGVNGFSCQPLGDEQRFLTCVECAQYHAFDMPLRQRAVERAKSESWEQIAQGFAQHLLELPEPKVEPAPMEKFWAFLQQ